MNTMRILAMLLCAVMLLCMIPAIPMTVGAAEIEGDWMTYRDATEYPVEGEEEDPDRVYNPAPGYEYTEDGFTVIQPDWTNITPFYTIQTKDKQSIKDGIYLEFRIDEYDFGGPQAADQWICVSLNTEKNVKPGNTNYGGNWLSLIRGGSDGNAWAQPHVTDPATEDFGGTFIQHGGTNGISLPKDEEGRFIVTFELTWDGSAYEMKFNGTVMPGATQATELLEKLSSDGDFYVGITIQTMVKGGTAGLTITKFGTTADDAMMPVGSDSKAPESNEVVFAEIADPSTVEANKPAILWDPTTRVIKDGNNCSFIVLGDDTWRVTCSDAGVYYTLATKNSWSYAAEDFPMLGVLYRNLRGGDSGTIWYAAGDVTGAQDGYYSTFSIYDGKFYEDAEGNEYVFVPFDMEDLWEGRINSIRVDINMTDPENREFDICFAGMFRSEEEAFVYAEEYLAAKGVDVTVTEAPNTTAEPETQAPDTNAADTNATVDTNGGEGVGTNAGNGKPTGGCASVVSFGAVAVLATAAAFVALKKKD